ncbi:MAG: carboxymuconolactone decarboxylase family protein [Betaproteobacteria bacterium]|nr:carboxymuconolactone decarboxylase family protein [Betaproteobacteria bacterium]
MAKSRAPKIYLQLKRRHPRFFDAVDRLGQAVRREGPLNEKTIQLVQLAAAAAIRSEGAVHSHVRRALEAGATPDEVRQTLLVLASTIGFPNVIAASSWAADHLPKK